jgi:opacity protein-like surface antigen
MVKGLTFSIGWVVALTSASFADFQLARPLQFSGNCDSACCDSACDSTPNCDSGCLGCGGCQQPLLSCDRYWTFFGGWNEGPDYSGSTAGFQRNGTYQDGFVIGAALGRNLGCHLRQEFEFAYRYNEGDQWSSVPQFQTFNWVDWNGSLNVFSGMSNWIYDIGDRNTQKLTPYIGGGVGFAFVDGQLSSPTTQFQYEDSAFAYQGFAGAKYRWSCNRALFAEYRFFGTDRLSLYNATLAQEAGAHNYQSNNVIVGIQFLR